MIEEYKELYENLISEFIKKLPKDDLTGIPCPMIPCVGEMYEKSKYRIAFFGMETRGWGDLQTLVNISNSNNMLENLTGDFKELEFIEWTNNFHTSYWDYVLEFLRRLYKIDNSDELKYDEKYQNILRSFIWGNTNSLERYEVTAKNCNVNEEIWNKVKDASLIFDSAKYILETCKPNVLIINNWNQAESWLIVDEKVEHIELDDHIWYYFLPKTNTHVYWLSHPNWLSRKQKFDSSITTIINDLNKKNIDFSNTFNQEEESQNDICISKQEYIGKLAMFLSSMNKKMSGMELANHLNRNGIRTSYNFEYVGTRGTYTLIRNCYSYFKNQKKSEIANAIAVSFVKENGDFAYE